MKLVFCSLLRQKGFLSPVNPSAEIFIRKKPIKTRACDSVGARPAGLLELSSVWSPREGLHSACLHAEVQMAAQPISVSTRGRGWQGLAEKSHSPYRWHWVAKSWRQLKVDHLREGHRVTVWALLKCVVKLFYFWKKEEKIFQFTFKF